jgi:hypothetical protein
VVRKILVEQTIVVRKMKITSMIMMMKDTIPKMMGKITRTMVKTFWMMKLPGDEKRLHATYAVWHF